jgi:DNA-binding MarR family transcriptional regulator
MRTSEQQAMSTPWIAATAITTFPLLMHKVFHDFHAGLEQLPLNRTHMKALMVIYTQGFPHMTQLCSHMNMEKGSLTPVIDSLIGVELVHRKRDPHDRRKVILDLTQKGRTLVEAHLECVHRHVQKKLERLPKRDVERFRSALQDLYEIAQKL